MLNNFLITGFYAGLLVLWYMKLSFSVIKLRRQLQVGIGDGGESKLQKAIRVHANFSEYIPFALCLLAIYEFNVGNVLTTHIFGASLLISRILHAQGLMRSKGHSNGRFIGMAMLYLTMLVLAVINVVVYINAQF
ncbi:MAPEG family protein [Thalassotalea agarivorans]|uniref:Glutathione S-transferase n=1 Tax=Thalassotalea agarivorans TaxID=349064 RepID=A0A1I0DHW9_THASX|nr:MAPEG family protein [Thalassotalea agarivorans]SET31999.1 hypothetical protein SAMN05660429_01526 [Thalassotalea agarivorans]